MIDVDIEYETHEFCTACGNRLSAEYLVDSAPYSYNKTTGKPVYAWAKKCPNYNSRHNHDMVMTYKDDDSNYVR